MNFFILTQLAIFLQTLTFREVNSNQKSFRNGKLLNLFSLIRFANDPCMGSNRNGTCFTSIECLQKGGINDGPCAEGFGVCCTFSFGCGATSSQNCTYFAMSLTTRPTNNPCVMKFCKCNSNICRMRLDFISHVIADPEPSGLMNSGECKTDTFVVTSPGNKAPPVICGYNTGQHMFIDASEECNCNEMSFNFGTADTTTNRMFNIKVTQYKCGSEKAGPKGCLQYFTGSTGQLASFNFRTDLSEVTTSATHLVNQDYSSCFRRENGNCRICFSVALPNSFGLDKNKVSAGDEDCTSDYLTIPGATLMSNSAIQAYRLCGKVFNAKLTSKFDGPACTSGNPFNLRFFANEKEEIVAPDTEDDVGIPSGNIGYFLKFEQSNVCP